MGLLKEKLTASTRRNALYFALWAVILGTVFALRAVALPFLLAILLAYVIEPLVSRVAKLKIKGRLVPRWGAILLIYLGFFAVVWAFAVFFVPQIYKEFERLAEDGTEFINTLDQKTLDRKAAKAEAYLRRMRLPIRVIAHDDGTPLPSFLPTSAELPPDVDAIAGPPVDSQSGQLRPRPAETFAVQDAPQSDVIYTLNLTTFAKSTARQLTDMLSHQSATIFKQAQRLVGSMFRFMFSGVLVLMITAFLAMDIGRIKRFFFSIVPVEDQDTFDTLIERIDRGLSGVVRGQLTICGVNGVFTLIGLTILGVKFSFILATLAAVFSLVPIFGSILSTIPIVVVALTQGLLTALLSVLWIVGIHFVEANFLNPKIIGDAAKIHPVVVVFSLIAGEHFYGIVGALFAVPIVSILLTLFRFFQARASALDDEARGIGTPLALGLKEQSHVQSEAIADATSDALKPNSSMPDASDNSAD
ncbi:MAG: AI-2E family transporter [Deltaproteobacteria bacterium]|nr:AI-2E family transporter [Deltaproteobacteria bacterium]